METINKALKNHPPIQKDEAFWKNHYSTQQASGLSRADYCRKHTINYDNFTHWIGRWRINQRDTLIPIKIKSPFAIQSVDLSNPSKTLCTLDLKNGHRLRVHDSSALLMLLDRWQ